MTCLGLSLKPVPKTGSVTCAIKKIGSFQTTSQTNTAGTCDWSTWYCPPVIGWSTAQLQWVILLSFTHRLAGLLYVIVHTPLPSPRQVGLCYCPLGQCYCAKGYVIVHMVILLSTGLCYRPKGYVIINDSTGCCLHSPLDDNIALWMIP